VSSDVFSNFHGKNFRDRAKSSFLREKTYATEQEWERAKKFYAFSVLSG